MNYPRVSIIILNWNGWRDTIECLESLYRITYPNYDVIVVDNGSKDKSVEKIKQYARGKLKVNSKFFRYNPENKPIEVFEVGEDEAKEGKFNRSFYEKFDADRRMILIKNKDNYGFAGGNNVGIKFALSVLNPDYVLLLNNDTVVDSSFLEELIKTAKIIKNKNGLKIGWYSPIIFYYDKQRTIQYCGLEKFSWIFGIFYKNVPKRKNEVGEFYGKLDPLIISDLFTGAAVMFPKSILLKHGLLDENMFMGWEDNKYSFTLNRNKYKGLYIRNSRIYHKGSVKFVRKSFFRMYQDNKNKIYTLKCYAKGIRLYSLIISHIFLWMPLEIITASLYSGNNIKGGTHAIRGIVDGFRMSYCNKKRG